jgi:hypothetical protein
MGGACVTFGGDLKCAEDCGQNSWKKKKLFLKLGRSW